MTMLQGPIKRGGPRFLSVFGSILLLIWGFILIAAAGTANALAGGDTGTAAAIGAIVIWIAAILSLYVTFSDSAHGQRICAGVAVVSLIAVLPAWGGWVFWWLFAGGLVGVAAVLSARSAGNARQNGHDA